MDLSFNVEQKQIKESAHDFLKKEYPWTLVKQVDESESGLSRVLWDKTVQLGWLAMPIPKKYGGSGASVTDLGVLNEEMGQVIMPGPYFSSAVLCGAIIAEAGSEKQKKEFLPAIAQGKKIFAIAVTEPDYGWGPEFVQLSAKVQDAGFVLNGTKRFVHDAQSADYIICVARTRKSANAAKGITLFVVDKKAKGISLRNLEGFVGEKVSEVTFNSVKVPESGILGEQNNGWAALRKPFNRAAVVMSAYMVGGCQRLLEMTTEFSQTRVQFGQPVGAFQWVQGYVIGQANHLEKARWFTYEALWKLDANKPEKDQDMAVSLAKAVASEAFHGCVQLAHEVFAGKGIRRDFALYLYSKKAKTLYPYLGDPTFHKKQIAMLLKL